MKYIQVIKDDFRLQAAKEKYLYFMAVEVLRLSVA